MNVLYKPHTTSCNQFTGIVCWDEIMLPETHHGKTECIWIEV